MFPVIQKQLKENIYIFICDLIYEEGVSYLQLKYVDEFYS